jgi:asparagine synthase (glutamine-hydrolysing)
MYNAHGAAFARYINRQLCGLLIDTKAQRATLFNDRFGLCRFYYHDEGERLYFATEAKALLDVVPTTRRIDLRGIAELIAVGCVMQNRTIFSDIHVLQPASAWTFRANGTVDRGTYFHASEWENQPKLTSIDYTALLFDVFERATKRCIDGEPLAVSLTGGLDSRAVLAWAGRNPGALPCYTFGGMYRDCADVRIARALAGLCGQPHTTIPIGREFLSQFDVLAERCVETSDGTMDISGAVELYANRRACGVAPVRLTGNYGSELVRSHVTLRPTRIDWASYTPEFCERLNEALDTYAQERAGDTLTFIAFKQIPWHHYARRRIEAAELTPRSPFLDNDIVALAYRAPTALRTSSEPMLKLIAAGNPALAAMPTDRALRVGRPTILARLATGWKNLTAKAECAYDYGMPQWLATADWMLSRLQLERMFLGRHKFYHFRVWYRDQLNGYVRDHLLERDPDLPWFRPGRIRALARAHLQGRANQTLTLHHVLTFQLINRLFLNRH